MRKAAVMIGFGAFFLTMALLMRFYAYPKLAVVPLNQNTQQTVADDNAKYFDADKVKAGSGKILTKATVVADKAASEKVSKELGRDVVVIDQWQSTDNFDDKGQVKAPPMSATTQRVAIDRSTGEAVKWDGNELNGKPVDIKGQTIKFPFQVDKDAKYEYWDTTLAKAIPVKFAGEDKINGMKTYKFTQSVPKTTFTKMDVPGEIFGLEKGKQTADRTYANERTIWVDPVTGVMMKLQEKQKQTLELEGQEPVNAMDTTSTMTPETVAKNVDEYKSKGSQLNILRNWAPLVLGLLGLLALVLGLIVSMRSRRSVGAHAEERRDDYRDDYRDGNGNDNANMVFGDRRDDGVQY